MIARDEIQRSWELRRRVVQSRAGGRVERCHGIPHHGSYSNAAHSWGVAMLMFYLWPADFPKLAIHCLDHDVPEAWVGDVPAPPKRYVDMTALTVLEKAISRDLGLPWEDLLTPEERRKLKNCDQLELWLWSAEQIAMGNDFASEVITELEQYWLETPLLPEAADLVTSVRISGCMPKMSGVIRRLMTEEQT